MRSSIILIALLSGASACAPGGPTPDFYVDGIGVKLETSASWATPEALAISLPKNVEAMAAFSGRSPESLRGWVVVFTDGYVDCGGPKDWGCEHGEGWIEIGGSDKQPCAAMTALPHELLHAFIGGDTCHVDPLWLGDWNPVANALRAGSCYANTFIWRSGPTCHEG